MVERLKLLLYVCILCCIHIHTTCATNVTYGYENDTENLVENWSFEEPFSANDWSVRNAKYEVITNATTAHTGSKYVRIHSRKVTKPRTGLRYYFKDLKANNLYYMSVFLRLPDPTGTNLHYDVKLSGLDMATKKRTVIGKLAQIHHGRSIWVQLGGELIPEVNIAKMRFELEVTDRAAEYYVDTVSLINIPLNDDWQTECSEREREIRKNTINIVVKTTLPQFDTSMCKMFIEVEQIRRDFLVGSAIIPRVFMADTEFGERYRETFASNFGLGGTINALKWKPTEKNQGEVIYNNDTERSIDWMVGRNIPVRGHTMLWSVLEGNPTWVQSLFKQELLDAVNNRIDNTTEHYKDRIFEWDVVNEYDHGNVYTNRIPDPYFLDYAHNRAHDNDPNLRLTVNDYDAVSSSIMTSALAGIVHDLLSRNVPVNLTGAQSHIRDQAKHEQLKKRFEILTATGLPLMLTEASLHFADVTERAEQLNILLKTAMCTPGVAGVMFWSFSNHSEQYEQISFEPDTWSMFDGPEFEPNAAGDTFIEFMSGSSTRTNFYYNGGGESDPLIQEAYHGGYVAKVHMKYKLGGDIMFSSKHIKDVYFDLDPGADIDVEIPIDWAEVTSQFDLSENNITDCLIY